jgi:hypothetical protein
MTKISGVKTPYSITVRRKIGRAGVPQSPAQFGVALFGVTSFGSLSYCADQSAFGIYQMRMCQEGKLPIRMKFYAPTETPARIANPRRAVFADAITAWQNLTQPEKLSYNVRARLMHMSGYNLFIKNYLRSS